MLSLKTGPLRFAWTPETTSFRAQEFFLNLYTCRTDYKEHFIFWKYALNRFQLILKKLLAELDGPQCTELDNFEFELRL
jgi:hypothetical protein